MYIQVQDRPTNNVPQPKPRLRSRTGDFVFHKKYKKTNENNLPSNSQKIDKNINIKPGAIQNTGALELDELGSIRSQEDQVIRDVGKHTV